MLRTEGRPHFESHRAAIEALADYARRLTNRKEARTEQLVARWTSALNAAGLLFATVVVVVAIAMVRRSVIKPLPDVGRQFEAIGEGRYDTVFDTSRCDEIGAMLVLLGETTIDELMRVCA